MTLVIGLAYKFQSPTYEIEISPHSIYPTFPPRMIFASFIDRFDHYQNIHWKETDLSLEVAQGTAPCWRQPGMEGLL